MLRGPARRAELLDGLIEAFLDRGFAQLQMADLAVRLQCSKSTLYAVAPSKEQLIATVVRAFFKRAADRVERGVAAEQDPTGRLRTYLDGIAAELAPASAAFHADLQANPWTREIYAQNTAIAARRVQELVAAAQRPGRPVDAAFVGAVAAQTMAAIQQGELRELTGLDDAAAYRALADLITAGLAGAPRVASGDGS